ncbi:hypothetical protein [Lentzea sp. NBRC 105346]|uniref:hypothetical protein n=1 Tax=Lentzea sp. NBRC 105346 TaxID=3032205 RepID=UPI002555803C|nr:hypothetical protein [Lentzea sp. NBRC 105346]
MTWRTADVLAAENGLTAAVAETEQAMRAAAANLRGREPSTEDIRRVMQFAKTTEASPALRALQDRIARGGLSWRQVLTGEASHDPMVRQALDENRARLAELIKGEEIKPPAPRRRPRDEDEPQTYTEDAW